LKQLAVTRLLVAGVLAMAAASCGFGPVAQPSCLALTIDLAEARATQLALGGEPVGTRFEEQSSKPYTGGPAPSGIWRIQVDAIGVYPQANQPGGVVKVPLHWIIDVDACTGASRIYGQG
jgi:hypothetical protein